MITLLNMFSVKEIIIFVILFSLAIKGLADFLNWFKGEYKKKFNEDFETKTKEEELIQHYQQCKEQHKETIQLYEDVNKKINKLTDVVDGLKTSIDQLIESDMHDAKGWIVEKHHSLVQKGWVDDFTRDTIEKRFSDYLKEGGNSYVRGLMEEIRALPHVKEEGRT